jgi:SAM-dependent methyltransferase
MPISLKDRHIASNAREPHPFRFACALMHPVRNGGEAIASLPRSRITMKERRTDTIYERPRDYDLDHEGDDQDVRFYVELVKMMHARRVLELGAGSGRVTVPLAKAAAEHGFDVVGLELSEEMLAEAERKRSALSETEQGKLTFVRGDLREWKARELFDLILTPCSSLTHLLTIDDQVAAWRRAHDNLVVGGRYVVDLVMPNLPAYVDSMQTPPRTPVEIDIDTRDPDTGDRLLRYKTTRYIPHEQRAEIRFLYDKLSEDGRVDRYISDFDCHVYYPREVELLFHLTGFDVERRFGDYQMRPLRKSSRAMIFVGIRR